MVLHPTENVLQQIVMHSLSKEATTAIKFPLEYFAVYSYDSYV